MHLSDVANLTCKQQKHVRGYFILNFVNLSKSDFCTITSYIFLILFQNCSVTFSFTEIEYGKMQTYRLSTLSLEPE